MTFQRLPFPSLAAFVAVLLTGSASLAASAPEGDAFYAPPSPLPGGEPGDVIWYRESVFTLDATTKATATDVSAYQVLYRSTSALGNANAVSGTVLVPRAPYDGPRPVVGYAVGTVGMGDACAPSKGFVAGSSGETAIIQSALARGWAVALTDYEGLGTPGLHTYVVNLSLGHAVLDSIRAAMRIDETGLGANSPVLIWGYSEGGAAAAAAAEEAKTYAPELDTKGVASGAAPADLVAVAKYQDGQIGFGSVFIAGLGFDAGYPELRLRDNLNDLGKSEATWAETACIADIVVRFASRRMSDYTLTDPLTNDAFVARLEENHLGKTTPAMPVYLYHGEVDQVIPLAVGEALRDAYCKGGAKVSWTSYPGAEHVLGQMQGFAAAGDWLADRLKDGEAPSVCPPSTSDGADGGATAEGSPKGDSGCAVTPGHDGGTRGTAMVLAITVVARLRRRGVRT
jgi:pimeloyl-ACP methyl ester carboxylesterase